MISRMMSLVPSQISAGFASVKPGTGLGYELQAIAAVVIGGTSLSGGKGTIVGTIIGALIISVLNNGLQIMSIPQEWQNVILGIVILVAVYADMARKRTACRRCLTCLTALNFNVTDRLAEQPPARAM